MTRRRRRSSRTRKCSNSKESGSLPIQPDCQNTTTKKVDDEKSMNSARKNTTAPPENGVTQSSEESSDDDSKRNCQGACKSKMQQNAIDYKVDTAEDKITLQALIKQSPEKIITVTIERSQLDPEIIESSRISLQHQADNADQEATARVKCNLSNVEVEIKNISFSGNGVTFVIGNKGSTLDEYECSKCQRRDSLSSCSAKRNSDRQTNINSWLKLSITTNDTDLKVSEKNNFSYRDNISVCEQNCYENFTYEKKHSNDKILYPNSYLASEGSCSSCALSDFSLHAEEYTSSQNLHTDCFLNIPPPEEFADGIEDIKPFTKTQDCTCLVQENHGSESDTSPITTACSERHLSSDLKEMVGNASPNPRSQSSYTDIRQESTMGIWTSLSECNFSIQTSEELPMPLGSTNNDFSKDKIRFRNNSIANFDSSTTQRNCQKQLTIRRKTYPDINTIDIAFQMEWKGIPNLLHQGQQRSSLTPPPPFFIHTLPRKQGKPERVSIEDIKSYIYFKEYNTQGRRNFKDSYDGSRITRWSSSGTLSLSKSPEISPIMLEGDNLRFESEESIDDVFYLNPSSKSEFKENTDIFRTDLYSHQNTFPDERMKMITNTDIDSWQSADPQEQGDFAESGFDEETLDSDYPSELVEDMTLTNEQFQIQITPPSPNSASDDVTHKDHASKSISEFADVLGDTISKMDGSITTKTADKNDEFKKRRHSVTILQIGFLDQRLIIQKNAGVSQHFSAFGECNEEGTLLSESNTSEMSDLEPDSISSDTVGDIQAFLTTEHLSQVSLTTMMDDLEQNHESSDSSTREENKHKPLKDFHGETMNVNFATKQNNEQHNDMEYCTDQNDNTQNLLEENDTLKGDMDGENIKSLQVTANCPIEQIEQPDYTTSSESEKEMETNRQKTECAEKQKWQQDPKAEASCILQLPTDPIHKEGKAGENRQVIPSTGEGSDYWTNRRKQFKDSKQSTGANSVTSNQESVNSEETRSVDLAHVRTESEQRGIYTESFNSTSWIFRGDEGNSDSNPHVLRKRAKPAAIRERTVKIDKGTGDYPWGFRIQFSKPILVTEVDTNGAAEEAGLQIGDIVLAVNGTDVTSIPHSEAATLARQGSDILTLTVGSDISRSPNTPRPACRGYLHKRTQSGLLKGWRKRWFVLKHDGLFYYYKNKMDEGKCQPLDVMKLEGADVSVDTSLGKPFVFKCTLQTRNRVFYFCSTSNQEMKRWLEAMERAVHPVHQHHVWVDVTRHNANLPPLAIKSPECLGLLYQVDRNKDVWVQHYCVLKDGCIYFYAGIRSTHALGGIYLQGYTVSEQSLGSKRTVIEAKPPSEECKTFYLCADNAADNKRWIVALKASISKWLPLHQAIHDFMTNPPEETRM